MNRLILINITLFIFCLTTIKAQEVVTGLQSNPLVRSAWKKSDKRKGLNVSDTLNLPFFDDFSKLTVYPDQSKWLDNYVFINNTYSNQQKTVGVATFDALDNTGRLYETASTYQFMADQLTSKPINLSYSPSDNVYLSFFYEPGGLSDEPEPQDSLTLQFYAPSENIWYSVWRAEGTPVQPFRAVIIPVDNPRFLQKGFQFRFINYASLSSFTGDPAMVGNCDIWNLDYVLLDKNRNSADTIPHDVAFTLPVRSVLKTYEAMPWRQFRQVYLSEMGPWIQIHYQNNDKIVRNVTRNFEITDVYKNALAYSFSAGATNIDPGAAIDYKASLLYTFNSVFTDSALFRIKSYIITDVLDPKPNDTIIYYQKFGNYFAFDDGTAESGYGINGLGSRNAMVAFKFKSFVPDTLRAIQICFNDSYQNANLRTFDLMVWPDNNGIPGDAVYTQEEMMVQQGDGINGFYTYVLDDPLPVNGDFYVGWRQRSETFLNAGFDMNTPNTGRQFYWLNGNWNQSQAKGCLMIRPMVGPPVAMTPVQNVAVKNNTLKIWPNPAKELINIDPGDLLQNTSSSTIRILDIRGNEVMNTLFDEQINVSSLPDGIYFIVLNINGNLSKQNRFVKIK
jgi:Secretion system C-terminal sorting domain